MRASFWSCPAVRLSRTWRRMNSGGSEGGEAPALTTLPQLWTERRPGARVETGDGMETETESRPPPPPPATSLLCPRHRQPRSHDQTQRRGGEAGVLGGPARWRYCITAGLHMRPEPSVNTASCPGTWAQRGAGRCGTLLLRHGATRGTPSPQQHSCSPPQPLVHGTWATWCRSSPRPAPAPGKLPSQRSSHAAVSSVQYCQGPAPAPATAEHNWLQRR